MGYKIKAAREKVGMTQAALAKKAGVSRSIINGLETGRCTVTMSTTLVKIASALGVTVDSIFFEDAV